MEEASGIAKTLVQERLAACANFDVISSVYRWAGRLEEDTEVSIICKTRTELVPAVIRRARELHSYEIPCITSWKIDAGYEPYLEWVKKETSPEHEAKDR
jgi:periplasmic divalent cation tolerance protein